MKSFLSRSVTLSINRNKETFKDTLLKKASPFCDTINIDEHSFKYIRTSKNLISFLPKVKGTIKEIGRDKVLVDVVLLPKLVYFLAFVFVLFIGWFSDSKNSYLPKTNEERILIIVILTIVYLLVLIGVLRSELHKTKTDFIIWFGGEVEVLKK